MINSGGCNALRYTFMVPLSILMIEDNMSMDIKHYEMFIYAQLMGINMMS
jgi:hypothetical protein